MKCVLQVSTVVYSDCIVFGVGWGWGVDIGIVGISSCNIYFIVKGVKHVKGGDCICQGNIVNKHKKENDVTNKSKNKNFKNFVFDIVDHQNYFGIDDALGPVAISIRKEKVDDRENNLGRADYGFNQFRVIVRTSEVRNKFNEPVNTIHFQ